MINNFAFPKIHEPARYFIRVLGVADQGLIDPMSQMRVRVVETGSQTTTEFSGSVADQAALFGILETLYDFGMTLLLVQLIPENHGASYWRT